MDISKVIAENLTNWMEGHKTLGTLKKLAAKAEVGFGTARRAKNGDGNITAKHLQAIAEAFGRQAADLLTPPRTEFCDKPLSTVLKVAEPDPDRRLLLAGYDVASGEARRLMLLHAQDALELFERRNEKND